MATPDTRKKQIGRRGARRFEDRRFSFRALYLTCLVLTILALVSFWPDRRNVLEQRHVLARDTSVLEVSDEACRLVHSASDKCSYIRSHCPDDEPGFLAYLDLYYCSLSHVKPIAFIILMLWLGMLFSTIGIAASDFFCINLSTIATILGMSESLAGVTFLAFGNGSPDLFSTFAAMSTNSSSLAIGELFGAACFITAVVAGSMALVRPFKVAKKSFVRDVGMFTIAVAFSMGFLSDGHLYLWECIGMVIYYVFYVAVVVVWHWWITRRARKRQQHAVARGHYSMPGTEEAEVDEEYLDDPTVNQTSRPNSSRVVSAEDLRTLEGGGVPRLELPDDDDDDDTRDGDREILGEIATGMLLPRPGRNRRNTITPVRPSLVGALEFQAIMHSLNRQRSLQTIPMHARRYSDAQAYAAVSHTDAEHSDSDAVVNHGAAAPPSPNLLVPEVSGQPLLNKTVSGRSRAVSANDAAALGLDPKLMRKRSQKTVALLDIPEHGENFLGPPALTSQGSSISVALLTPDAASHAPSRNTSPSPTTSPRLQLTPPTSGQEQPPYDMFTTPVQDRLAEPAKASPAMSPRERPKLAVVITPDPETRSPRSLSPLSPFPNYQDTGVSPHSRIPSFFLPPPTSASVESHHFPLQDESDLGGARTPTWWPTSTLPPPGLLKATLVPTLCNMSQKTWWERILGIVAAPSVFLLTITLPVVDGRDDDDGTVLMDSDQPVLRKYSDAPSPQAGPQDFQASPQVAGTGTGTAAVAAKIENHHPKAGPGSSSNEVGSDAEPNSPTSVTAAAARIPQRWLTIVQLYLAPVMIVLMLYMQYIETDVSYGRAIVRPTLIALLVSTVLLVPLLLTTTASHRPRIYGPILSLAGFVVSIAWISTIASQVVALLKTFAVILNMSHAILGLTVFAVGNSLGDLVADITVAKLGFPVMALSACFGGPMLNILLGIGLSGCYELVRGAQKRYAKHPDRGWRSGAYDIEVGDTLIVSGVTLLTTLVGLLVAVPMSNWTMTKKIAWGLIAIWVVGTVVNVVLEVTGVTAGTRS